MISKSRYKIFGSFRFTLAVLVMLSHSLYLMPESKNIIALSLGNVGVFLFFVLSGFVIIEALESFYKNKIKNFLLNRFMKIYPTYWFSLTFTVIIYILIGELSDEKISFSNIFGNIIIVGQFFNFNNYSAISISWAVVVELFFYIGAAAVFFFINLTDNKKSILLLSSVIGISLYVLVHLTEGYTRFYGHSRFIPYFLLGGSIYYFWDKKKWHKITIPLIMFFGTLSIHSFLNYLSASPEIDIFSSSMLFIALLFIFFYLSGICSNSNFIKFDKKLGDVTYFLYLIHMGVVSYIDHLRISNGTSKFILVQIISIFLAFAFYHYLERPLTAIRDKIRGRRLYN